MGRILYVKRFLSLSLVSLSLSACTTNTNQLPADQSEQEKFNLGGTISKVFIFIIPYNSYANNELCESTCDKETSKCVSLFELNNKGESKWICDTQFDSSGKYNFSLKNKKYFSGKKMKISASSFEGQNRELISVFDSKIENKIKHDVNSITTIEAKYKEEKIKVGADIDSLKDGFFLNDLRKMCPALNSNLDFDKLMKNSLPFFMSKSNGNLLLEFRQKSEMGASIAGLVSQINILCGQLADVVNWINNGKVMLRLVDKSGSPHQNIQFVLDNTYWWEPNPDNGMELTTDMRGIVDITAATNTKQFFQLIDYTPVLPPFAFLWAYHQSFYGFIEKKPGTHFYQMTLPKVLFSEPITAPIRNYNLNPMKKFYAQPFTIQQQLDFCGIGYSIGGISVQNPAEYQIRSNNYGVPSNQILFESKNVTYSAATNSSLFVGGAFANFCNDSIKSNRLESGNYWLVVKYTEVPKASTVWIWGSETGDANNSNMIFSSNDGNIWASDSPRILVNAGYNMTGMISKYVKKLSIFISE